MIIQTLINCAVKAVLGEAVITILKIVGVAQDADSFVKAAKSGNPEKIIVESLRLAVSLFTLKCQCFTGYTLEGTKAGACSSCYRNGYISSYDNIKWTGN